MLQPTAPVFAVRVGFKFLGRRTVNSELTLCDPCDAYAFVLETAIKLVESTPGAVLCTVPRYERGSGYESDDVVVVTPPITKGVGPDGIAGAYRVTQRLTDDVCIEVRPNHEVFIHRQRVSFGWVEVAK